MVVIEIKDKGDWDKAFKEMNEKKTVIVDFTATWCGPCKMIGPKFVELSDAGEFASIKFLKVDVDEAEEVAASCEVSAMPTFQVYKDGKKVDELVGANKDKLAELCGKYK